VVESLISSGIDWLLHLCDFMMGYFSLSGTFFPYLVLDSYSL